MANQEPSRTDALSSSTRSADTVVAAGTAAAMLAVYATGLRGAAALAPLADPLLAPSSDAPWFQYLQPLFGTPFLAPHQPYGLILSMVAAAPVGSAVSRLGAASAVCGAAIVALTVVLLRRLGCTRPVAAAAGLALGLGGALRSASTTAGVDTLHACLVLAVAVLLLDRDRARGWAPWLAVVLIAAAAASDLSVIAIVPAIGASLLADDMRHLRRPAFLLALGVAILGGVALFAASLVRALEHAPYFKAAGWGAREALAQLRDDPFSGRLLDGGGVQRVVAAARHVTSELGFAGCVIAALGIYALGKRRRGAAILMGTAALGIVALPFFVRPDHTAAFLLPSIAFFWSFAALGLDGLLANVLPARRVAGMLVVWAVLIVPPVLPKPHAAEHPTRAFAPALQDVFAHRSVIVAEDTETDRFVLGLSDHEGRRADVIRIPRDRAVVERFLGLGHDVYAFEGAHEELRAEGVEFVASDAFRRPSGDGGRRLFQASRVHACLPLATGGWTDISSLGKQAVVGGRIRSTGSGEGRLWIDAARGQALHPSAAIVPSRAWRTLRLDVAVQVHPRDTAVGESRPAYRFELPLRTAPASSMFMIAFGGPSDRAAVRLESRPGLAVSGHICALPVTVLPFFGALATEQIRVGRDEVYFGNGWHEAEGQGASEYRWTAATEAELLVPLSMPRAIRVTVHAMAATDPVTGPVELSLRVNERRLPAPRRGGDWHEYAWLVPADAWRQGLNQVFLTVSKVVRPSDSGSPDGRTLGAAVRLVTFEYLDRP